MLRIIKDLALVALIVGIMMIGPILDSIVWRP